jgi:transcriptional regulator with XRE-family HTH domain
MGFTHQKDLAEALEIDPSKVSRWETGGYFPGQSLWPKIVALLDLNEDYFFGDQKDNSLRNVMAFLEVFEKATPKQRQAAFDLLKPSDHVEPRSETSPRKPRKSQ